MKKYAVLFCALLLAACQSAGAKDGAMQCPDTGLLREAGTFTVLTSDKAGTAEDVIVSAEIVNFSGTCRYRNGEVEFELGLDVLAKRGPKGPSLTHYNFPYFIAILSPERQILQRQAFSTNVSFDNTGIARAAEPHVLRIPVTDQKEAGSFQVLIGFELTPEQVARSRKDLR